MVRGKIASTAKRSFVPPAPEAGASLQKRGGPKSGPLKKTVSPGAAWATTRNLRGRKRSFWRKEDQKAGKLSGSSGKPLKRNLKRPSREGGSDAKTGRSEKKMATHQMLLRPRPVSSSTSSGGQKNKKRSDSPALERRSVDHKNPKDHKPKKEKPKVDDSFCAIM